MKRVGLVSYYVIFGIIYGGLVVRRSTVPDIGPYAWTYLAFLLLLAVGFVVPPVLLAIQKKYGTKHLLFAIVPTAVLGVVAYVGFALTYYYTQTHRFDPFLQNRPATLTADMLPKPANVFRVVTLGGSTTQNGDLAPDDRYPAVLERLLQAEHPNVDVQVLNAGRDWYTSKHSLINYVTNVSEWQPDVAVVMHAVNDMYRSCAAPHLTLGEYNRLWSHFYGPSGFGAKPPSFEEHILGKFFGSRQVLLYEPWRVTEHEVPLSSFVSIGDFERHLQQLVHYLSGDGVAPVLVTQPFVYRENMTEDEESVLWFGKEFCIEKAGLLRWRYPSANSMRVGMVAFNDVVRRVATEQGIALADAEPALEKSAAIFVDDVHYTVEGARQLAQIVANQIIEQRLIGRLAPADPTTAHAP